MNYQLWQRKFYVFSFPNKKEYFVRDEFVFHIVGSTKVSAKSNFVIYEGSFNN